MVASKSLSPLVVVVGETASGKSALALKLAQDFNGELICADSWTVRREVDIGTAKPTSQERSQVRHHLLDIVGPDEDFTAAVFKELAIKAIDDINARGKLAIMVGGSGLYIDSVVYNYSFLPAGDRADRELLNQLTLKQLLDKISNLGIELGDVDKRNKRRLIRLIETNGARPTKQSPRSNTLVIGINPDRETLKTRITARVDQMFEVGLEKEVRGLVERYGWDCEALRGISYAQWRGYFEDQKNIQETRELIIKATLSLAKRQRTWFKRRANIHWFSTPVNYLNVVDEVTTFMADQVPS